MSITLIDNHLTCSYIGELPEGGNTEITETLCNFCVSSIRQFSVLKK